MSRKTKSGRKRVIRRGSPVLVEGRKGRVREIIRFQGAASYLVIFRDGILRKCSQREVKPLPQKERGVLLKDIPAEEIRWFSDGVKESGPGYFPTRDMTHEKLCYVKYASFERVLALVQSFPSELAQQQIHEGDTDEAYRWIILFELAAIKKLFQMLGLSRPESYYRPATNVSRFIIPVGQWPPQKTR